MDPRKLIADLEAEASPRGHTVDRLCERAGINRATWQRIKSGRTQPSFPTFTALQALLAQIAAEPKPSTEPNPRAGEAA